MKSVFLKVVTGRVVDAIDAKLSPVARTEMKKNGLPINYFLISNNPSDPLSPYPITNTLGLANKGKVMTGSLDPVSGKTIIFKVAP